MRCFAHHGLRIFKLGGIAMGRNHQLGACFLELAFQLQTQTRRVLLQHFIRALHKFVTIECLQLAELTGKVAPEGINLLRCQRLLSVTVLVWKVCAHG